MKGKKCNDIATDIMNHKFFKLIITTRVEQNVINLNLIITFDKNIIYLLEFTTRLISPPLTLHPNRRPKISSHTLSSAFRYIQSQVTVEPNICSPDYDGIVLVSGTPPGNDEPEPFKSVLYASSQLDAALFDTGAVLPINLPAKRLIYSPTGPINPDYDDVRAYSEAAVKGIKR